MITWKWLYFSELSLEALYKILKLRQEVFVLEQQCFYQDVDDIDYRCWHLLAMNSAAELVAYLRVMEPGIKYAEPAMGRVVVRKSDRATGLGKRLMIKGMQQTTSQFSTQSIRLSAQQYSVGFYRRLGFQETSKRYLEDGIPHVEMYWDNSE